MSDPSEIPHSTKGYIRTISIVNNMGLMCVGTNSEFYVNIIYIGCIIQCYLKSEHVIVEKYYFHFDSTYQFL